MGVAHGCGCVFLMSSRYAGHHLRWWDRCDVTTVHSDYNIKESDLLLVWQSEYILIYSDGTSTHNISCKLFKKLINKILSPFACLPQFRERKDIRFFLNHSLCNPFYHPFNCGYTLIVSVSWVCSFRLPLWILRVFVWEWLTVSHYCLKLLLLFFLKRI